MIRKCSIRLQIRKSLAGRSSVAKAIEIALFGGAFAQEWPAIHYGYRKAKVNLNTHQDGTGFKE